MAGEPAGDLAVGLLGPFEVTLAGRPVPLTTGRLRTLLAVLAISAGRAVPVERLTQVLWADDPPDNARRSLQTYVTRLRSALCPGAIGTTASGYVLHVDPDAVDALRFTRLLDASAAAGDRPGERARLVEALGLWRGTPFGGVHSAWLELTETQPLVERYLAAVERRVDLDLADGRYGELAVELSELTARYPLRESLWVRLLAVLAQGGRQAEALAQYEMIRVRLAGELGVDPGPELRQAYADLLAGRQPGLAAAPGPDPPAAAVDAPPGATTVPRQLPAAAPVFTGRATELAELDRTVDSTTVVITAIDGMAGIGKTALAVHAAHRVADRYPDGQLFIDLHGYTEGVAPTAPGEALDRLLRALGVPGEQIPAHLDERAALYRSRLAGQRMLVLLDNAATEDHVTPLLPGAPGCLVLVTSRRRLAGLDHIRTVSLDTLSRPDAVTLFHHTAGARRLAGEPPELVAEAVELCGRLPLAIHIAAARLRSRPAWRVAHLVDRLRDRQQRLAELEAGQRSVTAALDLSYQQLAPDQRRCYRFLGLHPGSDIDTYAAAALIGTTPAQARRLLDRLLDAHLLQESDPDRHRFHDLTRAHAAGAAARDEPEPDRRAALTRLFDYYRYAASTAMDAAYPYEPARRLTLPAADPPTPTLPDPTAASAWLDAELPNLLASAAHAADHGWPAPTVHLSAILHRHLRTRGRYRDAETLHHRALDVARTAGDRSGELMALTDLGRVHWLQGRHGQAIDDLGRALEIARATGDHASERDVLSVLGGAHLAQGRHELAVDHFEQVLSAAGAADSHPAVLDALTGLGYLDRLHGRYERAVDRLRQVLDLARQIGDRVREMHALRGLGHVHRLQGHDEQAADTYRQALATARGTGHLVGELNAVAGLGHIHRSHGEYEQAAGWYRQVLDLARRVGDRNWQFEGEQSLGRLHHAAGRPGEALACHRTALALATEIGQPGDQVRAHDGIAHAHHALGRYESARQHWRQALDTLTALGTDHTEEPEATALAIRAHLADLDHRLLRS